MGIVLSTIALTSLFVSAGTSRLLANSLLPLDPGGAGTASPSPGVSNAVIARKDPTNILRRNIFDSAMGPQDGTRVAAATDASEAAEAVPEPVLDDPSHPPSPCQGSVRLVGSFYWPRSPERSFAAITDPAGKVILYRQGGTVDGREVVAIGSNMVYLRPSGQALCSIAMFNPPGGAGDAPAPSTAPVAAQTAAEPAAPGGDDGAIPAAELDRGITRVSDTEYGITRSLVDRVLANQADLMRQVRIVPQEEGGRVTGVKMYGIRRNSVVGRLGLQNGDTLRTINGYDMTSPDSALEAYTRLRTADHLTLSVIRRGAPTNMNYSIH
jgi:general secretion pathway protein C